MKINEVAKLTGVTVRTLHYYDEIGLLSPSKTTEAGYRLYNEEKLALLQQILFFRELDFPLNQIKEIMTNPAFESKDALKNHKALLIKKRERLEKLIKLVEKTMKGGIDMSFKEFDMTEIEKIKNQYAAEVKEKWGNTSEYAQCEKKTSNYGKAEWKKISKTSDSIFKEFAENMNKSADNPDVQGLVKRWQDFISENFYKCTNEILQGLGQMYVADTRFKENIDKYADGLAGFISKAIEIYCK